MMHGSKKRKRSVSRFSGKIPLCFLCRQRLAQEMHHIQPMKFGGADKKDNVIPLCKPCHRRSKLHSWDWENRQIELLTLKFYMESLDADTWPEIPDEPRILPTVQEPVYQEAPKTEVLQKALPRPLVVRKKERIKIPHAADKPIVRRNVRKRLVPIVKTGGKWLEPGMFTRSMKQIREIGNTGMFY